MGDKKKYLLLGSIILIILSYMIITYLRKDTVSEADLQSLEKIRMEYYTSTDDTTRYELVNKLVHDALKYNSDRYTASGYFFLMQHHQKKLLSKEPSWDSIYHYYTLTNEYYEKSGYEMGLVNSKYSYIHTLLMEGNQYIALDEALKSHERFKDSKDEGVLFFINWTMFVSYLFIEEWQGAENGYKNSFLYLDKTFYHLNEWSKTSEANRIYSLRYHSTLLEYYFSLYYNLEQYEMALFYSTLYRVYAELEPSLNPIISKQDNNYKKFEGDCLYACVLSKIGLINEAKPIMEKLQKEYENPDFDKYSFRFNAYYEASINYYRELKDYDKVFEYVALQKDVLRQYDNYSDWLILLNSISDIYYERNDYISVIKSKDEMIQYIDSVNRISTQRQIDYVKKTSQMELEAVEAKEKIRQLNYVRGIAISLGVICALLATSIYIKIRSNRLLKEKNERILMQYKDIDKYINDINNLTDQLNDTDGNTRELSLFERIEKHLHTTRSYSNPAITRETLALELGTNRQYLTQAIHDERGQSFMEYINDLRLEYARRLLFNQPELTVDRVCSMSGFSTRSTFYRLFKQKYGLTPTEIRDLNVTQN